jgi:hypothetical protein
VSCFFCEDTGFIPYCDVGSGDQMPCDNCMVCCGCGKRFRHAKLCNLGGGGPFCLPCAERIEAEMGGL